MSESTMIEFNDKGVDNNNILKELREDLDQLAQAIDELQNKQAVHDQQFAQTRDSLINHKIVIESLMKCVGLK